MAETRLDSTSAAAAAPAVAADPGRAARRRYWRVLGIIGAAGVLFAIGLLVYGNPVPVTSPVFWTVVGRRVTTVVVIVIVAVCHAFATVAFQTATNNRILTPSIMGFESLYLALQTGTMYVAGAAGLLAFRGVDAFLLQVALMLGFSVALYGWLLSGRFANIQIMLLVGIIIGGGLGSLSNFMQRLLTPSEFDLLTARMFGSVNNADPAYFPIAIPLVVIAAGVLYWRSHRLNVVALGRDMSNNLGVPHKREVVLILMLVAVLMSVSTALVGPITFLGFLVATLAYQFSPLHNHRYLLPMAGVLAFTVLTGAYFIMNHLFNAQGVVSIIIELVGGVTFLVVVLRRKRL